jgi:4'-phosphopantetheinyl transferase
MEFDLGPPEAGRWFTCAKPRPRAAARLFCFSFAGGAGHPFDDWPRLLPSEIEVVTADLPGQATDDVSSWTGPLAEAIRTPLDLPFAFFGYGGGALVAFEVARALRDRGRPMPSCLFLAGPPAPHDASSPAPPAAPLPCPIAACGSLADAAFGAERLDGWRAETGGPFFLHLFSEKPACLCRSKPLADEIARELWPDGAKSPSVSLGRPPFTVPPLSPRQLHLWRICLDQPPAAATPAAECLSPDEQRRAARFVRQQDRERFATSHAALRMILGQYLGMPPSRVEIVADAGGKPRLAPAPGLPPLMFNLSHSADLALVGVALGQRIGVDVEPWRPMVDAEGIVKRYFSAGERARWQALAEHERLPAFFRGWTRKEAYLKARGVGLSAGLDRFEVSFAAGEPTRLVEGDDAPSAIRWQVYDFSAGDHAAACAVEGDIEQASVYDWPLMPCPS